MPERQTITDAVKSHYSAIATNSDCCKPGSADPCCGTDGANLSHGYTSEELALLPAGAALGLGCGNPTAHAAIARGEVVVDLGSGAGIDCFLAARAVGERGLVIGVDMTEEMLAKARANAASGGYTNVEFRRGEIDHLPIDPGTVDLVISNCVINLAPDKRRVFREIYRVLKPGGRFCVSDVVSKGRIPDHMREDLESWACCLGGAMAREEYLALARQIGFERVDVKAEVDYDYQKSDDFSFASVTVLGFRRETVESK